MKNCMYAGCWGPQGVNDFGLCERHYQQAWDRVLSKPPRPAHRPEEPPKKKRVRIRKIITCIDCGRQQPHHGGGRCGQCRHRHKKKEAAA